MNLVGLEYRGGNFALSKIPSRIALPVPKPPAVQVQNNKPAEKGTMTQEL